MKNHLKAFLGTFVITLFLILPFFVFAQPQDGVSEYDSEPRRGALGMLEKIGTGGGYEGEMTLPGVAGLVVSAALSLLGVIFIVLIIVGGFKWLTAGGDENEVALAKKYISRSIIGLIIILSSWAIWSFVISRLG